MFVLAELLLVQVVRYFCGLWLSHISSSLCLPFVFDSSMGQCLVGMLIHILNSEFTFLSVRTTRSNGVRSTDWST